MSGTRYSTLTTSLNKSCGFDRAVLNTIPMTNVFPKSNETGEMSFIALYQTLLYQFRHHHPKNDSEWGLIRPMGMLFKTDADDPGIHLYGLCAAFTVLDRQIILARWEFPTGSFAFVNYRELRSNSEDPYACPFKKFPLHYLTSYRQLTEGSTAELNKIADAAADSCPISFHCTLG